MTIATFHSMSSLTLSYFFLSFPMVLLGMHLPFLINYIEKHCTKHAIFPEANQEIDSNYRKQTDGYHRGSGWGIKEIVIGIKEYNYPDEH